MSSIWHVIEAVVRWLYAHLASVGISAVVTAIGGAVMWFLGFRKAKLNNQKLALEIDHIKIDTKRPGAPGAEGCPTHSRSFVANVWVLRGARHPPGYDKILGQIGQSIDQRARIADCEEWFPRIHSPAPPREGEPDESSMKTLKCEGQQPKRE